MTLLLLLQQAPSQICFLTMLQIFAPTAENKWNPAAISDALFQGLSESVKAQMIATDVPDNLESNLRLKEMAV